MFQAIGPPAKEHNRYFELRQILLRGNLSIDSDKGIELLLSQREQVTILDSSPAATRNRNNRMVGEFSRQSPIDALIRCPPAAHPLRGFVYLAPLPAGSIRRARSSLSNVSEHAIFRFLEKRDHLFARDSRETFQEILDRLAAFEVINQILDWHTRARETRRTAHDFGIDFDDGFTHASECGTRRELLQQLRRPQTGAADL